MSRDLTNALVPFEDGDRPDLDALEDRFAEGSRIMLKVMLAWALASVVLVGLTAVLTAFAGPVGAGAGAVFLFMVVIHVVTRRRLVKLRADLHAGKKLCVEGPIERKEVAGQGGTRSSAPQYFLHIGGRRFWVDSESYSAVEEGAEVRFEYLPTSELVLRTTKL